MFLVFILPVSSVSGVIGISSAILFTFRFYYYLLGMKHVADVVSIIPSIQYVTYCRVIFVLLFNLYVTCARWRKYLYYLRHLLLVLLKQSSRRFLHSNFIVFNLVRNLSQILLVWSTSLNTELVAIIVIFVIPFN